jgi:glucose/arabinose dehydrogenase
MRTADADGALYVADIARCCASTGRGRLDDPPAPAVVSESFPDRTHHGWKFIGFGPDGLLYVPVGAPCNVCLEDDPRFASIMRMRPDGSGLEVFASGIRNTVGFAWEPATGELWFTDNGRDMLGDDVPDDELNRAPGPGLDFGFRSATRERSPTRSTGAGAPARPSCPRRSGSALTWPPLACGSTTGPCSRLTTAARF